MEAIAILQPMCAVDIHLIWYGGLQIVWCVFDATVSPTTMMTQTGRKLGVSQHNVNLAFFKKNVSEYQTMYHVR